MDAQTMAVLTEHMRLTEQKAHDRGASLGILEERYAEALSRASKADDEVLKLQRQKYALENDKRTLQEENDGLRKTITKQARLIKRLSRKKGGKR